MSLSYQVIEGTANHLTDAMAVFVPSSAVQSLFYRARLNDNSPPVLMQSLPDRPELICNVFVALFISGFTALLPGSVFPMAPVQATQMPVVLAGKCCIVYRQTDCSGSAVKQTYGMFI